MFEMDNPEIFVHPVSIPDIINSLFFWKETYSKMKYKIIEDALDKSIGILLPLNDLLIEQSEMLEVSKGKVYDS